MAWKTLVGFSVGGHLMSDDPLNMMIMAELEMVKSEELHTEEGVITTQTTPKMMT